MTGSLLDLRVAMVRLVHLCQRGAQVQIFALSLLVELEVVVVGEFGEVLLQLDIVANFSDIDNAAGPRGARRVDVGHLRAELAECVLGLFVERVGRVGLGSTDRVTDS